MISETCNGAGSQLGVFRKRDNLVCSPYLCLIDRILAGFGKRRTKQGVLQRSMLRAGWCRHGRFSTRSSTLILIRVPGLASAGQRVRSPLGGHAAANALACEGP